MNRREFKEYMRILREDDARRTKGVFEALEHVIKLTHKRAEKARKELRRKACR